MGAILSHGVALGVGAAGAWWVLAPSAAPTPGEPVGPKVVDDTDVEVPEVRGVDVAAPTPPEIVPAAPDDPASACDARVARVEAWCDAQVWAAGGALPVPWPDDLDPASERDVVRSAIEETVDRCLPEGSWHLIDCDEFPCALYLEGDGKALLGCDESTQPPLAHGQWSAQGHIQARFYYPVNARDADAERFRRREDVRVQEGFSRMVTDGQAP